MRAATASLHAARSGEAASTAFGGGTRSAAAEGREHRTVGAALFRAEQAIARVAQPGDDVAVLVQVA
ncbi:MAG TPA: hypothetical protein VGF76_23870, partial [Polyangiaceae bacterium]